MNTSEILIKADSILKIYQPSGDGRKTALDKVSVSFRQGEYTAVMGPSGSGKSTLLYALSGMDGINSGTINFRGSEIGKFSEKESARFRLERMGFIFQHMHLLKNLNIRDNILAPAMLLKKKSPAQINESCDKLLELTGISDVAGNAVNEVSGGQKQRAAICRALINGPDIIFGDEPTGALDSRSASEIMDLLSVVHEKGATIILVTHDVHVAANADRILFMSDGRIKKEHIFTDAQTSVRERETVITEILLDLYEEVR